MEENSKKYVRLTRNLIREIFDECNEKYFDNQIERPVKFELWTHQKKCVGWVRAIWNKKKRGYDTWFHISSRYHWTRDNLRNVVLHEMIHLDIKDYLIPRNFWNIFFPKRMHGKDFIERMNELNRKYGLDIRTQAKFMRKELIK